jgi:hypothetical protein
MTCASFERSLAISSAAAATRRGEPTASVVDHRDRPAQPARALPCLHRGRGGLRLYSVAGAAVRARIYVGGAAHRAHWARPSPVVPASLAVVAAFADLQNVHRQPIDQPRSVPCGGASGRCGTGCSTVTGANPSVSGWRSARITGNSELPGRSAQQAPHPRRKWRRTNPAVARFPQRRASGSARCRCGPPSRSSVPPPGLGPWAPVTGVSPYSSCDVAWWSPVLVGTGRVLGVTRRGSAPPTSARPESQRGIVKSAGSSGRTRWQVAPNCTAPGDWSRRGSGSHWSSAASTRSSRGESGTHPRRGTRRSRLTTVNDRQRWGSTGC